MHENFEAPKRNNHSQLKIAAAFTKMVHFIIMIPPKNKLLTPHIRVSFCGHFEPSLLLGFTTV